MYKKARDPIFGFPAPESVLGRNPGLRAQAGFSHVLIGFGPKGDQLEVNRGGMNKKDKSFIITIYKTVNYVGWEGVYGCIKGGRQGKRGSMVNLNRPLKS